MVIIPILLIIGSYIVVSIALFFFPTLLHSPHQYPKAQIFQEAVYGGKVLRIAHRGGARIKTENTIEAFEQALKHSDMIELDVCETKDGVLVVHHDESLQRTCGVSKQIQEFQYKDLPPFRQDLELNFAPLGRSVKTKGEKIPTLEEVFIRFPELPMNIELKTKNQNTMKKFVGLINAYKRKHITFVGIRNKLVDKMIDLDPHLMRFMGDSEFFFYFIAFIFGFLPYIYVTEHTMQVPLWTQQSYEWKVRQWGNNWKVHLFFKVLKLSNYLMKMMAFHLRRRGIMTYYWVCNDRNDFERAIRFQGCGIMTDDPPLLNQYLQEKMGKYESKEEQLGKQKKNV